MNIYTHEYDRHFQLAMPVLELAIHGSDPAWAISVEAIVDSGADATIMPYALLRQLNVRKERTAQMRGVVATSAGWSELYGRSFRFERGLARATYHCLECCWQER